MQTRLCFFAALCLGLQLCTVIPGSRFLSLLQSFKRLLHSQFYLLVYLVQLYFFLSLSSDFSLHFLYLHQCSIVLEKIMSLFIEGFVSLKVYPSIGFMWFLYQFLNQKQIVIVLTQYSIFNNINNDNHRRGGEWKVRILKTRTQFNSNEIYCFSVLKFSYTTTTN